MKVVLLDLDNTLYDWVSFYIPSFNAMLDELVAITGIDRQALTASFKRVHEQHRTTEYSFALQELDVLRHTDAKLTPVEIYKKYDRAIHLFRRMRNKTLHPYRGVRATLKTLKRAGLIVGAATESLHYHAVQRLKQLRLEQHLDFLASAPDHDIPNGLDRGDIRVFKRGHLRAYEPAIKWIPLTLDVRKPNPQFLHNVLREIGCAPDEAVYVGDSLKRDVLMAQRAGTHDVFAAYGTRVEPSLLQQLVQITYWTAADLEADRKLSELHIHPTKTIHAFPELLTTLGLEPLPGDNDEEEFHAPVSSSAKVTLPEA